MFAQKRTWGMDAPFQPGGSAESPSSGGHGEAPSNVGGIACGGFSYSGDLQTPGVVHLHLFSLLGSILEEAASPGGLCKVPQGRRSERLTSFSVCFLLQDYIFYLEPDKLESGKGKCSYDPKVDTVSALISESCSSPGLRWAEGTCRRDGTTAPTVFPCCPDIPQEPLPSLPTLQLQMAGHPGCPVLGHLAQCRWGSWLQTSANLLSSLGC